MGFTKGIVFMSPPPNKTTLQAALQGCTTRSNRSGHVRSAALLPIGALRGSPVRQSAWHGRGRLETALVARWTKTPAQEPVRAFDGLRVKAKCASTARAARHQAGVEGIGPPWAHNSAIMECRSGKHPTS
jgi:hypothetical protein